MISDVDLKEWFATRNISHREATKILTQLGKQYPWLGKALASHGDMRAKLDAVELVFDVQRRRFPVRQQD